MKKTRPLTTNKVITLFPKANKECTIFDVIPIDDSDKLLFAMPFTDIRSCNLLFMVAQYIELEYDYHQICELRNDPQELDVPWKRLQEVLRTIAELGPTAEAENGVLEAWDGLLSIEEHIKQHLSQSVDERIS